MFDDDDADKRAAEDASRQLQMKVSDASRYCYETKEAVTRGNEDRVALMKGMFEHHLTPLNANLRALHKLGTIIMWLLMMILGVLLIKA